jgi:hypothetical protein
MNNKSSFLERVADAVGNRIGSAMMLNAATPSGPGGGSTGASTSGGSQMLPATQMAPAFTSFSTAKSVTREALIGVYSSGGISINGYGPVNPYRVQNGVAFKQYVQNFITEGSVPFTSSVPILGNGVTDLFPPPGFSLVLPPAVLITFGDSDLNFVKETIVDVKITYVTANRSLTTPNVETFNINLNAAGSLLLFGLDSPTAGSTNLAAPEISLAHRGLGTWTGSYRVEVANAWPTLRTRPQILPADHPVWEACLGGQADIEAALRARAKKGKGKKQK